MAWITLEAGLHTTVLGRMQRNLKDVEHRVEGDAIQVPDDPDARRVLGLLDELIACHERILHYADPAKATPYKPLERDVLYVTLVGVLERHPERKGPDFLADLLHSLVWAQPLPNTNHRSSILLIQRLLHRQGSKTLSPETEDEAMRRFVMASKRLILEQEFAPDPSRIKDLHLKAAQECLAALNRAT